MNQIKSKIDKLQNDLSEVWYKCTENGFEEEMDYANIEFHDTLKENVFDYWFGMPEKEFELNKQFIGFGKDNSGSNYAIWIQDNKSFENQPVVLVGSEGELRIVATNYLHFLYMIAKGFSIDGNNNFVTPNSDQCEEYVDYLKQNLNVKDFDIAEDYVRANKTNPNFKKIVQEIFDMEYDGDLENELEKYTQPTQKEEFDFDEVMVKSGTPIDRIIMDISPVPFMIALNEGGFKTIDDVLSLSKSELCKKISKRPLKFIDKYKYELAFIYSHKISE